MNPAARGGAPIAEDQRDSVVGGVGDSAAAKLEECDSLVSRLLGAAEIPDHHQKEPNANQPEPEPGRGCRL
ncbi:hypothetical protein AJ79_03082 [Helicocarpus griseus UAMH5409]|uniref:Uncharacterized protein n=1 Tax=Helicocarpus griseus UAMH5409 TaxID=1447875 RepID=A0A2B7XZU5_9EURO|nr:hypothetical protein AJ79_03082 [Helicocarpus griseus UAMH5409]